MYGGVAQLVERPFCTRKVSGSNPLISTSLRPNGLRLASPFFGDCKWAGKIKMLILVYKK